VIGDKTPKRENTTQEKQQPPNADTADVAQTTNEGDNAFKGETQIVGNESKPDSNPISTPPASLTPSNEAIDDKTSLSESPMQLKQQPSPNGGNAQTNDDNQQQQQQQQQIDDARRTLSSKNSPTDDKLSSQMLVLYRQKKKEESATVLALKNNIYTLASLLGEVSSDLTKLKESLAKGGAGDSKRDYPGKSKTRRRHLIQINGVIAKIQKMMAIVGK